MNNSGVGMVIRILENKIVVLVGNSRSIELKKRPKVNLGDRITFNESDIYVSNESRKGIDLKKIKLQILNIDKRLLVVGGMVLIIVIILIIANLLNSANKDEVVVTEEKPKEVYAYIDYNINPSIELAIADDYTVIEVKSFSDEGDFLAGSTDLMNLNVKEATKNIMNEMTIKGYINSANLNNYLLVAGSIKGDSDKDNEKINKLMKDVFDSIIKAKSDISKVDVIRSNYGYKEETEKNNISLGLYTVFKEAENQKLKLKIDNFIELIDSVGKVNLKNVLVASYVKPEVSMEITNRDKFKIGKNEGVKIRLKSSDNDITSIEIYLNDKLTQRIDKYQKNIELKDLKPGIYDIRMDILFKNGAIQSLTDSFEILEKENIISNGDGLIGYYFDKKDLSGNSQTRIDPIIQFNWNDEGPFGYNKNYSVRWVGLIEPLYSDTYTFFIMSDDGCRLRINGQELINNWNTHSPQEVSGQIILEVGQKYQIELEYYQEDGGAEVSFSWQSQNQPKQIVPQSQLYTKVTN